MPELIDDATGQRIVVLGFESDIDSDAKMQESDEPDKDYDEN